MKYFYLPAIALLLLAGCASQKTQTGKELNFKTADIHGMVYDTENRPCQGAKINLDGEAGITVISDVNGRFTLPHISGGKHTVTTKKTGFENEVFDFEYTSRKQVLYIRLISLDTLLSNAEKALDALEWQWAEDSLTRAAVIDPDDSRYLLLRGALSYRLDNPKTALEYWLRLHSKGHRDPYLYLIIADAYQYGLDSPGDARIWLEKYLSSRDDEEVRERLREVDGL